MLTQCQAVDTPIVSSSTFPPTIEILQPTKNFPTPNQIGCVLPSRKVSEINVSEFYWDNDAKSITFKELNTQNWFVFNIVSHQSKPVIFEITPTPFAGAEKFNVDNYFDAFISPSGKKVLFSRESDGEYALFYKKGNENNENYLGIIQGQIDNVEWFDNEEKAILAIDWQSPFGAPEASVYLVDFLKNEMMVEVPTTNDFYNIEYLGMTPDEKQLMLVSYANKDRNLILWNILTDAFFYTPIFKPLDFKWINEKEFMGVGYQNSGAYPFISVFVYNTEKNEIIILLDAKIKAERYLYHSIQISPDGSAIAYVDEESGNLYWFDCSY